MLHVPARHEPRRRAVIGIAEIETRAHVRRRRNRGDDGVAIVGVERADQRVEAAHLHRAGDLELLADHPRQIDIEAGRRAIRPGIVERRIIGFGEEADDVDARQIRPFRPPPRIPETGHGQGVGRRCDGWRRGRRALRGGFCAGGRRASSPPHGGSHEDSSAAAPCFDRSSSSLASLDNGNRGGP